MVCPLLWLHYSLRIMLADMCEINNNSSVVREIIEHILKLGYQTLDGLRTKGVENVVPIEALRINKT